MLDREMTKLERRLCDALNVSYSVFTGNGTTAMYIAFRALALQSKKVLFPAISCTNPVNAAIYAGYDVDFCDIRLSDYTIAVEKLEEMLQTGMYGIIVPTHIYGHRYAEQEVKRIAAKYGVLVFEDAAQSYSVGEADVSVLSFGHTKICETPMGGGAVLTEHADLQNAIRYEKKMLSSNRRPVGEMFDEYRKRYYEIVETSPSWDLRNEELKKLQLQSRENFIFDMDGNPLIIPTLNKLNSIVQNREEKTALYENRLSSPYIMKAETSCSCRWRYTFLYKGDREFLLEQARKKGIDISSWYYSLAGIYKGRHLENADKVENHVVNLWVDESHPAERLGKEIDILNEIMEVDYERSKQRTVG